MKFDKYKKSGAYHWTETKQNVLNLKFNPLLCARYEKLAEPIPQDAQSIIDIGCGDGYLLYLAHKQAPKAKLVGLEYEQSGLKLAEEKLKEKDVPVTLKLGSVFDMPYPSNSFDVVLFADAIEHLDNYELAIKEIHRILKPGGSLLLSTPLSRPHKKWDPRHVHEFAGKELITLCSKYFKTNDLTACWPRFWVNCFLHRITRPFLHLLSCIGWSPVLKDGDPFSGNYLQLIIRCGK